MTLCINVSQSIKNIGTSPTLETQSSSLVISFQFSIRSTCLSYICFVYVHMNHSRFGILIPFSTSVTLFKITRLFFVTTSDPRLSISITLHCASTIGFTSVDCCTSTYTSMDSCTFASMMFSSPTSLCVVHVFQLCFLSILQ